MHTEASMTTSCQNVRPEPLSFSSTMVSSFWAISWVKWFAQSPTFPTLKKDEFSIGTPPTLSATPKELAGMLLVCISRYPNFINNVFPTERTSNGFRAHPLNSASTLTCSTGRAIISSYLRKRTVLPLSDTLFFQNPRLCSQMGPYEDSPLTNSSKALCRG